MTVEIAKIRPAVLRVETARALDAYLAFRHRFRNLYLFDLDAGAMAPLVARAPEVWTDAERDLRRFVGDLLATADEVEGDPVSSVGIRDRGTERARVLRRRGEKCFGPSLSYC